MQSIPENAAPPIVEKASEEALEQVTPVQADLERATQASEPSIAHTQRRAVVRVAESSSAFSTVTKILEQGIEDGVAPGMVLLIGRRGEIIYHRSAGVRAPVENKAQVADPVHEETVYDIAALTGTLITTTLTMKLLEYKKLALEDKVSRYVQGFSVLGKSGVSIANLLSHTSGLINWYPYFEELLRQNAGARLGVLTSRGAKDFILNHITRSGLKYDPGSKQVYSDLGLILLGHIVEVLTGFPLDKASQRWIFQPLGMKNSSYIDLSMIKRRGIHPVQQLIAPTEDCAWRKRILCGEVHDDNAWAMGGVAGHSGIFTSATDLHIFASEMLAAYRGSSEFLRSETVRRFWSRPFFDPAMAEGNESYCLGWDTPSKENGLADTKLAEKAVGMCGFTGCSMWLLPEEGVDIILMTNRIHPSRSNKRIFSFRAELHDAVIDALGTL